MIDNTIGDANYTLVDLPASVNVTVLLEINAKAAIGCCVQNNSNALDLQVGLPNRSSLGNLTISLETPDMQSQGLGVAFPSDNGKQIIGNFFPGAVVRGVWKVTFLASPDATGWSSDFSLIGIFNAQCV